MNETSRVALQHTRSSRDRNSSTGPIHVQSITVAHDPIHTLSLRRIHLTSLCPLAPGRRMANLAMTPQQSFAATQASSQRTQGQQAPHGLPTGFSQSFNMPYDGSPHAHPPAHNQAQHSYSQSFPNGPVTNPGYARSFGEGYGQNRSYPGKPQIYTVRGGSPIAHVIVLTNCDFAGRLFRSTCLRDGSPEHCLHAPAQ